MPDLFKAQTPELNSPAGNAALITKSDADDLPVSSRYIYVGGTGNINLQTVNGDTVLFTAVPVGTILPVRAKKVLSTNTTATLLIALY